MLKLLKEYGIAMWTDIVSRICGIASFIFLIIGFVINFKTEWQSQYWFWAVWLSYAIASFKVWAKDRPQLLIETVDIFVIRYNEAKVIYITIELSITNTKLAKNAIKNCCLVVDSDSFKLEGKLKDKPYYIDIRGKYNSLIDQSSVFIQGEPTPYNISFEFRGEVSVLTKGFVLYLRDSYNTTYKLKGVVPLEYLPRP